MVIGWLALSSGATAAGPQGAGWIRLGPENGRGAESASGEANLLQAPAFGFIYDRERMELQSMVGVPGCALLDNGRQMPEDMAGLFFAPGQGYALAEIERPHALRLLPLSGEGGAAAVDLPEALFEPTRLAFSPTGSFLALFSARELRLQLYGRLPEDPVLLWDIAGHRNLEGIRLLAVSDRGFLMFVGGDGNLYSAGGGTTAMYPLQPGDVAGLAFLPGGDEALAYDRSGDRLLRIESASGLPSVSPVSSGRIHLDGEIFLAGEEGRAILGSSLSEELWLVRLSTGEEENLSLPFAPKTLLRLPQSQTYLLSYEPGRPAWVLAFNESKGAAYFVPARPDEPLQGRRDRRRK